MYKRITNRFWMASGAVLALGFGAQTQAGAQNLLDWQASGGSGAIQSIAPFTMKNVTANDNIRCGKRSMGINLVWDSGANNNVRFSKQTGSGDVKYGEPIAVSMSGGGFLKYEKTRFGINLVYSSTPAYEWRIGGGEPNQSVKFGDRFALLSDVEHDAMIYGKRPVGINLVWMKDFHKTTWGRIKDATVSRIRKEAGDFLKKYFGS